MQVEETEARLGFLPSLPHRVQPVLLVQELGDILCCGSQHALVLQVLDASLGLLVKPVSKGCN